MTDATVPAEPAPAAAYPAAAASGHVASAARSTPERTIYCASGGRRTFFAFAFLLLLPFFASLPVMLFQRLAHGLWYDTWQLFVIAAGFTVVMAFVFLELLFSLRARVVIGQTGVRIRLPARLGTLPMPYYRTHEVPYDQIAAVETRREIYGGVIAPVLMRGARLLTKSGASVSLGYVSEADMDPCFPVPEIAAQIARRAGLDVSNAGNVHRRFRNKLRGMKASPEDSAPVSDEVIAQLNGKHRRFMLGLVGTMLLLLVAGIVYDLATASVDRGERARDATQRSAARK